MPKVHKQTAEYLLAFCLLFAWFYFLAINRLIAPDEGFYLIAAKLIAEGKTPYLDFFYPQAPLLPYFYALFFKVFGSDLLVARSLTALMTTLSALLIYRESKIYRGHLTAIIILLLFVLSNFVLANFLTVQTYALSTLLLLSSYLTFVRNNYFLSGIFLALAIQSRLTFLTILPIFLAYLLFNVIKKQSSPKAFCLFILAMLISLAPSIYFLSVDFDSFYFNNIGYHQLRNTLSESASIENKLTVSKVIFGLKDSVKFSSPQLPILLYLNIILALAFLLIKRRIPLIFGLSCTLLLTHLLPSPTYVQYFSVLIPFLLLGLVKGMDLLKQQNLTEFLLLILGVCYLYNYPNDFKKYTQTGDGVIGIMNETNAKHWSVKNIQKIMTEAKNRCNSTTRAWSYWPGYFLEANCQITPGSENHFAYLAASKLNQNKISKYKLINLEQLANQVASKELDLIIDSEVHRNRHKINLDKHYKLENSYFYLPKQKNES